MYEMLVGFNPFNGKDRRKVFQQIMKHEIQWPNQYRIPHTEAFKDLVSSLLVKNPKNRLGYKGGAEEILAHEWFNDIDTEALLMKELPGHEYLPEDFKEGKNLQYFDVNKRGNAL